MTLRSAELARAMAEHRALVTERSEHRALVAERSDHRAPDSAEPDGRRRRGDRDRTSELRRREGWAWLRVFRRYDDYERALDRLADEREEVRA